MTSLFSSFDLINFNMSLSIYMIMFWSLFIVLYKVSVLNTLLNFVYAFLGKFFNSLNNSNFSKNYNFLMLSVLLTIFLLNFFSIYPYFFPLSSQVSFILILSLIFWVSLMSLSFGSKFKGQFSHFIPEGAPFILSPFLFIIEIVSASIRPITLMVRLVANITAGHLLLMLLCSFVQNYPAFFFILSGLNMFEFAVSLIQAYILTTLISLYYTEI